MGSNDRHRETVLGNVFFFLEGFLFAFREFFIGFLKWLVPFGVLRRKSVSGQVVLITGSANGLGRLLAERFAKEAARLALWDVDSCGNEETARICSDAGAECEVYTVDLRSRESIEEAAVAVKRRFGRVHILVNNAGICSNGPLLDISNDRIQAVFDVNVLCHIWLVKAFLPVMIEENSGHIVSICSLAGIVGAAGMIDYSASKFAAFGFMESLQHELIMLNRQGVKLTTICPFFTRTNLMKGVCSLTKRLPFAENLLDPEMVADRSMEAILCESRLLIIPKYMYYLYGAKGLIPTKVYNRLATYRRVT